MGYYLLLQYFTFFSVANNQFSSAFILNLRKKTSVVDRKIADLFFLLKGRLISLKRTFRIRIIILHFLKETAVLMLVSLLLLTRYNRPVVLLPYGLFFNVRSK